MNKKNIANISELLENIKNITFFYIKKEYKSILKNENIKFMEEDRIKFFSNSLFDKEDELKEYILEELPNVMEENIIDKNTVIDTIDEMIDDRDLVINRLVTEISIYQKKKQEKRENRKKKIA